MEQNLKLKKGGTYRERSSPNYAYSTIKEIKKLAYLFNSWVLIIYATSCVSLLSFAIRSYNYSKIPSIHEMIAKKCH